MKIIKFFNGAILLFLFALAPVVKSADFNGTINYNYKVIQGNVVMTFPFSLYEKPDNISFNPGFTFNSTQLPFNAVGRAWSINDVQKITTCPANRYHDSDDNLYQEYQGEPVIRNQLCYGGKRLFLTEGDHYSNGAKYKIEDSIDLTVTYVKKSNFSTGNGHEINSVNTGVFVVENHRTGEVYYFGGEGHFGFSSTETFSGYDFMIAIKEAPFNKSIVYEYNTNKIEVLDKIIAYVPEVSSIYFDEARIDFEYTSGGKGRTKNRLKSVQTFHDDKLYSSYDVNIVDGEFKSFTECHKESCAEPVNFELEQESQYSYNVTLRYADEVKYSPFYGMLAANSSKYKSVNVSQGNRAVIDFNFEKNLIKYSKLSDLYPAEEILFSHINLLESYTERNTDKRVDFEYTDPYYDFIMERFLSFGKISKSTSEKSQHKSTRETTYYSEYPYSGYVKNVKSYDDVLKKEVDYTYHLYSQSKNIFEIKEESIAVYDFDDKGIKVNKKENIYQYDAAGNVTKISEINTGLDSAYKRVTSYYNYDRSGDWLGERHAEYLLPGTITNDYYSNGQFERSTTRDLFYRNFKIVKEVVTNDGPQSKKTKELIYNDEGRIKKESITYNGETRSQSFSYDGSFLSSTSDYYNNEVSFVKAPSCNKPEKKIDVNVNVTSYVYDDLCRVKVVNHSDGTSTQFEYELDSSVSVLGNSSYYKITEKNTVNPKVIKYFDINGKQIRKSIVSLHGRIINQDFYSEINLRKVSKPYFSDEQIYWESTYSNLLGKVKKVETALGVTSFIKSRNTITKTDAIGETENMVIDSKGRVIEKVANGSHIKFKYDYNGNLIYSDNSGVVSSYEYDSQNNLLKSTDSISGTIENGYDVFNNNLWSKDNNGTVISSKYDKLNRLVSKEVKKSNGTKQTDFFVWDDKSNGKLLISKIYSSDFSKEYFYNDKSKLSSVVQTSGSNLIKKEYHYDEYGRVSYEKFPNSAEIYKEYDDYGYLIGEYLKELKGINKVDDSKVQRLIEEVEKLKNQLKAQQIEDENAINLLKSELTRLKNQYYLESRYDVNNQNKNLISEIFVDAQGRTYRQGRDGQFYRQIVGSVYSCDSRSDRQCSDAPDQLILEEVQSPRLLMEDGSYEIIDGSTGATNYAPVGATGSTDIVRFYVMRDGLSSNAKKNISRISTGLNDEIYRLNHTQGGYLEMINLLEELEVEIAKKNIGYESNQFISNGLQKMLDEKGKYYIWSIDKLDQYSRAASISHGNGTFTSKYYDPATTQLKYIKTLSDDGLIRNLEYGYDDVNNMVYKSDAILNTRDNYSYREGKLFAHDYQTENSHSYLLYDYDEIGNISSVSFRDKPRQVYLYEDSTKPYNVTSFDDVVYRYDNNGNVVGYGDVSIDIGFRNKPITISNSTDSLHFSYDPDGHMYKQVSNDVTSYYFGADYRETIVGDSTSSEIFISAYGETQAILKISGEGAYDIDYLYSDPLGSIDTVLGSNGDVKQRYIYSAFGDRTVQSLETGDATDNLAVIDKSYTGHEELEEFGLIHMGGRVYDPNLRRFLSPDPIINDTTSASSYNLYSYVFNNPMKYTDPSGYAAADNSVGDTADSSEVSGESSEGTNDGSNDAETNGSQTDDDELGTNTIGDYFGDMVDGVIEVGAAFGESFYEAIRPNEIDASLTMAALGTPTPIDDVGMIGYWVGKTSYSATTAVMHLVTRAKSVLEVVKKAPNTIELSHPAALSKTFSDPRLGTVGDLAKKLKNNPELADKIPAIEVVKIKGKTYSANNRRLRAFQEAGVDVNTIPASKEQVRKIKQRLKNK